MTDAQLTRYVKAFLIIAPLALFGGGYLMGGMMASPDRSLADDQLEAMKSQALYWQAMESLGVERWAVLYCDQQGLIKPPEEKKGTP